MNILVTGSNGLVGSALVPLLEKQGHSVKRLIRSGASSPNTVFWNPPDQAPNPLLLEGIDAVVHLAGESIAKRWTAKAKQAIRESRVKGTQALVNALMRMKSPPKVFVSASAIGYYGNQDVGVLREDSPAGRDFLAEVCREWEAAAEPLANQGIRTVNLRFGIILNSHGGALGKMLLPFKMGLGGKIASGHQVMSWIALDDVIEIIQFALLKDTLRGPVNAVAPNPVANEEFTRTLGQVLKRPTLFPMPAFAARVAFGEMADALLIGGMRVEPTKLIQNGYVFRYPKLKEALHQILDE